MSLPTIPVGRNHELSEIAEVRTAEQRQRVADIVSEDGFDFACNNPFTPEVGGYVGPFSFVWYTTDGKIHFERIGKRGATLSRHTR